MLPYTYTVVRENRRGILMKPAGPSSFVLRVPPLTSDREIRDFLSRHARWIENRLKEAQQTQAFALPPYTAQDLRRLADEARRVIPERARFFAPLVGVSFGRITIRCQKSKWGSCSSLGNLNFNCLLMDAPPEVRDYVVVHELCHRLRPDHSPAFWAEVARVLPGYKAQEKWLRTEGRALIRRLTG